MRQQRPECPFQHHDSTNHLEHRNERELSQLGRHWLTGDDRAI